MCCRLRAATDRQTAKTSSDLDSFCLKGVWRVTVPPHVPSSLSRLTTAFMPLSVKLSSTCSKSSLDNVHYWPKTSSQTSTLNSFYTDLVSPNFDKHCSTSLGMDRAVEIGIAACSFKNLFSDQKGLKFYVEKSPEDYFFLANPILST